MEMSVMIVDVDQVDQVFTNITAHSVIVIVISNLELIAELVQNM